MATPIDIQHAIEEVSAKGTQESFLQRLLVDTLQWPIDANARTVEDTAFEWTAEELKTADLSKKIVENRVWQIQTNPLAPWGIFLLEFTHPDAFATGRGMTGPLRVILRELVPKARASANQPNRPVWKREHLLFICTHKYKHFRFAYFKAPEGQTKTAPLAFFGWSPDVPARTACEHNLPALQWSKDLAPAAFTAAWADAFNVEKVTKEFYKAYKDVFDHMETTIGKSNPIKGEDLRLFTQSLFNRLMFLRFIERKNWLKAQPVCSDAATRRASPAIDYLAQLFTAAPIPKQTFYTARLRPLFFEGLAKEHSAPSTAFGTVPFLNGGLFEQSPLDEKINDIPDAAFHKILHPIDGLFYRFNFTVEESTPLDIEVAVDPEMLGKVFEELVTGRHESGSYYTPRPVVSFMCREALKGYLADKLGNPLSTPSVSAGPNHAAAIAALVDHHNPAALDMHQAAAIVSALDALKAVDPACGSGAYLLGLLHELVALYQCLYSDKLKNTARSLYDLKLRIISHNLYGVDIDPFATNIAMLRLWLSLAVDADDAMPLPNLEFKIETGDSVCGPNPQGTLDSAGTGEMFEIRLASIADDLVALKEQYLTARGAEKAELKQIIQKQETEIAHELRLLRSKGTIMWRVQFAEAFSKNRGFNIVLANPPYIRQELIKDLKPALKTVYGPDFAGTADLYVFFYLRALQLLASGGMLVFISSNKWFRAGYGEKLRTLMAQTTTVRMIIDFHDLPVFESAIAYPMIFITMKKPPSKSHTVALVEPPNLDPPYPEMAALVAKIGHSLPDNALGRDGVWHLLSTVAAAKHERVARSGIRLSDYVGDHIHYGVKSGLSEAFVISSEERASLVRQDRRSNEIIKRLALGRDIRRWIIEPKDRWIIFTRRGIDIDAYPAIKAHLQGFRRQLEPKPKDWDEKRKGKWPGRKPGSFKWFEIQDEVDYHEEFAKPKIVYQAFQVKPAFAFVTDGTFVNNSAYIMAVADLYLLGVLNSEPFWEEIQRTCSFIQGGYQLMRSYFENAILPNPTKSDRTAIAALAQKCLDAKGVNCAAWEREIDERVAALYGIDPPP